MGLGLWSRTSTIKASDLADCVMQTEGDLRGPVYRAISGNQQDWLYGYSEIWKVGLKDQISNEAFSQLHSASRVIEGVYYEA